MDIKKPHNGIDMYNNECFAKKVNIVKWALVSRITISTLQFVSNVLVPDHNAEVFVYPVSNSTVTTNFDKLVNIFIGGFIRWDAQYFMHVAQYGYTYENTLAFFPLYPMLTRYISQLISYSLPFLTLETVVTITFLFLNFILFVKTALVLFSLTLMIKDVDFSYATAILFCFNPASIFFSAPYTECLYCYLTFKSIYECFKMSVNHSKYLHFKFVDILCCVTYVSLSTCTRSNGILNIGFFIYFYLRSVFAIKFRFIYVTLHMLKLLFYVFISLLPFICIQIYNYILYCTDFNHNLPDFIVNFAEENNLVLPGSFTTHNQSWCYNNLPFAYTYVQEHYWNVGFLKYYKVKQIPNFLIALPVILIIFLKVYEYYKNHKDMFIHLGIFRQYYTAANKHVKMKISKKPDNFMILATDLFFVCVVHIFILVIFCILFIHVQVITRMIYSANPAIYWFTCEYFVNMFQQKCIICYYVFYFVVGTIMFCNFLPWT